MSESNHSASKETPTSGEDYHLFPKVTRKLFPEDNPESSVMSSLGPSLPTGYRSLGQIIAAAASMGVISSFYEAGCSFIGDVSTDTCHVIPSGHFCTRQAHCLCGCIYT